MRYKLGSALTSVEYWWVVTHMNIRPRDTDRFWTDYYGNLDRRYRAPLRPGDGR